MSSLSADALRAVVACGGTVIDTPAGVIVVFPKNAPSPDDLIPVVEAARIAATSVRVLRDAIGTGALPAVGRQRDRAVKRGDLESWIETRRAPVAKVAAGQAQRVERRLARIGRSAA